MMRDHERGSAAVEAAIVFPGLLFLGLLLFAAVQVMTAHGQVDAAARAGARAASTATSRPEARARAVAAVSATLSDGSSCKGAPSTEVSGFAPGAAVTVTVSCSVDTVFSGIPGFGPRDASGSAAELVSNVRGGVGS